MMELQHGEKIKEIKGYEGSYAITSLGRVWSYRRNIWLSEFYVGRGYAAVRLCSLGKETDKKVHRLVADAFIKNPDNKPQVNHINGDKKDNRAVNLCWATSRENHQHACDMGLNSHFKLSHKDKLLICDIFDNVKISKTKLGEMFGITPQGVGYVLKVFMPYSGNA